MVGMATNRNTCGWAYLWRSIWPSDLDHMSKTNDSSEDHLLGERREELGHPRGTLAIMIIFGALFTLAWLVMYVFLFLQRGAPHS